MNRIITRTMCILLALVLMSSTAVSYTYAEYAKGASAADNGRSTNWGVDLSLTGAAFATKYVTDTDYSGIDVSVKSSTSDDIIAPGTTGTFTGIHCTGVPEVGVLVTIEADLQLTNWVVDDSFYCPLVITINGTEYDGLDYSSSAAFEDAIENAIKSANGFYAPGTNLAEVTNLNGDYIWLWKFDSADYGNLDPNDPNLTAAEKAQVAALRAASDAKDNALIGKANIALSVSCSVVQAGDGADPDGDLNDGGELDIGDIGGSLEWY